MEVRMVKKLATVPDAVPPVFLATAIEAVIRAGADPDGTLRRRDARRQERRDRSRHRDRSARSNASSARSSRERFPDHVVLGEEFSSSGDRDAAPEYCWVFDPVDGTTNYAHGLPIFCSSLALEISGVPAVAAIYDPSRRELFTAERGQGAWLNGAPLRVSTAAHADRFAALHRFSLQRAAGPRRARRAVRRVPRACRARCGGWARRRSISATSRPGGSMDSGSRRCIPGTSRPAR